MLRRIPTLIALALTALLLLVIGSACEQEDPINAPAVEAPLLAPPQVPPATLANGQHVVVHLEAIEKEMEIAPGVTTTAWTFNGSIPGPMIRVRVGDTVEIHLKNSPDSTMSHNIDLHAVNGPGGGAGATTVAPGEEKAFSFKATTAGLFAYHCAAGIVADHIANGMYGAILVDPPTGKPGVDKEFYVGQSDVYTADDGKAGHHDIDSERLLAEDPSYVVFNGNTKALAGNGALHAEAGDKVRIYFVDGGPNKASSFHVIGEMFDHVWDDGSLESTPRSGIQTVLVPPGGALITEFKVDVPGDYKLVDHAISRVSKGAVGTISVSGKGDPQVFRSLSGVSGANLSSHDMSMSATPESSPTAAATPSTEPAASPSPAVAGGAVTIDMSDSVFSQKQITVPAGSPVTFALKNVGKLPHNMRIAAANGNFDDGQAAVTSPEIVNAGRSATLTWTPAGPGTYKFRCDVHPDLMTGT
ncbi:MAG TPA: copper-containing nitrite reductase, partial [Tepidiformaceae bacterium]|nr:copper-containing nitrite reductase [Tepidiformaceae bacterium]